MRILELQRGGDLFNEFMINMMQKYGKIPTKCPMKPGFYYFYNLTFNSVNIPLASYFLHDSQTILEINIFTKIQKKFVSVLNSSFVGGIRTTI